MSSSLRWPSGRGDGGDFDGGDRVVEHQHRFVKANAVEPLLALFKYFLNHRTLLVLQSVALLRLSSICLDGQCPARIAERRSTHSAGRVKEIPRPGEINALRTQNQIKCRQSGDTGRGVVWVSGRLKPGKTERFQRRRVPIQQILGHQFGCGGAKHDAYRVMPRRDAKSIDI